MTKTVGWNTRLAPNTRSSTGEDCPRVSISAQPAPELAQLSASIHISTMRLSGLAGSAGWLPGAGVRFMAKKKGSPQMGCPFYITIWCRQ